jgi:hypothetical protein
MEDCTRLNKLKRSQETCVSSEASATTWPVLCSTCYRTDSHGLSAVILVLRTFSPLLPETVLNSIANIERLQNVMVQYLVHHHASAWSLQAISAPWGMDWHKVILACHNLSWFFCVGKIELQSGNISKEWMWTVHTLLNSTEPERTRTTSAKRFQPPWASNLLPRTLREQVANGP